MRPAQYASSRVRSPSTPAQTTATSSPRARAADTTERQQTLAARPPYRLESHTKDGTAFYTYADPDGCNCLYVGGPKEYLEYQRLRQQREAGEERAWVNHMADMDWPVWGPSLW